jgi:hypothetical protein
VYESSQKNNEGELNIKKSTLSKHTNCSVSSTAVLKWARNIVFSGTFKTVQQSSKPAKVEATSGNCVIVSGLFSN